MSLPFMALAASSNWVDLDKEHGRPSAGGLVIVGLYIVVDASVKGVAAILACALMPDEVNGLDLSVHGERATTNS